MLIMAGVTTMMMTMMKMMMMTMMTKKMMMIMMTMTDDDDSKLTPPCSRPCSLSLVLTFYSRFIILAISQEYYHRHHQHRDKSRNDRYQDNDQTQSCFRVLGFGFFNP